MSGGYERASSWSKVSTVSALMVTTVINLLLLIATSRHYVLSNAAYRVVQSHRASVQILVQILAGILGTVQVDTVTSLINFGTRVRSKRKGVSLNGLRIWTALCRRSFNFDLPARSSIPIFVFVISTAIPAAFWAGALTPVQITATTYSTIEIPNYSFGMQYIKEYPSEIGREGPSVNTISGSFSYSVGLNLMGLLMSSAASASTLDGGPRRHGKFDTTGYNYVGRSYGVGSSPGLVDEAIKSNELAIGYSYLELGYNSVVNCIYNTSTNFVLREVSDLLYAAEGFLPDSAYNEEYSVYIGHAESSVVAIGVAAHSKNTPQHRYLTIAAGSSYSNLNATQCTVDFHPTIFEVTVSLQNQTIAVNEQAVSAIAIDPSGNLTHVAMRQFELISNDQTNLYVSLLGDSFNASISTVEIAATQKNLTNSSPDDIALAGLQNSITAMMDDILVGYSSAQLMIAEDRQSQQVVVDAKVLQIGQRAYIYAVTALTALIFLVYLFEAWRTHWWRELTNFNYMDVASVIIAASRGGEALADVVAIEKDFGGLPVKLDLKRGSPCISLERETGTRLVPIVRIGGEDEEYHGLVARPSFQRSLS